MKGGQPASSSISVRRATPDDIDVVVRLRVALLREYPEHPIYGQLRSNAEELARPVFGAQLASGNEATFLAEDDDGAAIGIIRAVESAAPPFLVPERYCYVSSAYVAPEYRRHGVLRLLLARASEWCRHRGLGEMRLHSVGTSENASAAWDALGFEVVEQVRVRRLSGTAKDRVRESLQDSRQTRSPERGP